MEIHTGILMLIIGVGMVVSIIPIFTAIAGTIMAFTETTIHMEEGMQIIPMEEEIQTEILETTP